MEGSHCFFDISLKMDIVVSKIEAIMKCFKHFLCLNCFKNILNRIHFPWSASADNNMHMVCEIKIFVAIIKVSMIDN